MAEKELRKMRRAELIEIIYTLQQNEENLKEENRRLQEQLDDRIIKISEAGSIADAAIALNNIFQNAQEAAEQYLESVTKTQEKVKTDSEFILSEAKTKAIRIVREAEQKKQSIEEETEREIAEKWNVFENKVNDILSAHSALKGLLDGRERERE